jgi:hypothetical protein
MRPRLLRLLPVIVAAGLYLPSAAGRAVLDADEALYVQAPREMMARHDWITPYVDGVRFLDKPPLLYWLLGALYRLLGPTELAAHLPPALAVIVTTAVLTGLATRAAGPIAGLGAGLAFALSAGTYLFTRETLHDGLLVLFITVAIDALARWSDEARPSSASFVVFGAALAGGVLSKGLVGVVLPLLVAIAFLARDRLPPWAVPLGVATFLVLAVPWHVLAALRNPRFVAHYVLNEQVLRFLGRREPLDFESIPLPLFLVLLLVWFLPWTAFLPALVLPPRGRGAADALRVFRLGAVWAAVVLAFLVLSARLEHYAFLALPPLALLSGLALARDLEGDGRTSRAVAWGYRALAVLGVVVAAIGIAGAAWMRAHHLPLAGAAAREAPLHSAATDFGPLRDLPPPVVAELVGPATVTAAAVAFGFVGAWWRHRRGHAVQAMLALSGTAAVFAAMAHASLRTCEDIVSSKRFGVALAAAGARADDHVVVTSDFETANSVRFYAAPPLEMLGGEAPALADGLRDPDAPRRLLTGTDVESLWKRAGLTCVLGAPARLPPCAHGGFEWARSIDRLLVCNRRAP